MEKKSLIEAGFSESYAKIIENTKDYEKYQYFDNYFDDGIIVNENKSELYIRSKNIDTQNAVIQ